MVQTPPHSVEIDGVEYERKRQPDDSYYIVVLERGFVIHGCVSFDGRYLIIDDCCCIRRWGTTQGLGELSRNGPTEKTILDPQRRTRVHELQVIELIEADRWTKT